MTVHIGMLVEKVHIQLGMGDATNKLLTSTDNYDTRGKPRASLGE